MNCLHRVPSVAVATPLVLLLLAGCAPSALQRESERDIRNAVIESARRELEDSKRAPEPHVNQLGDRRMQLNIKPEVMPELEAMAGPASYKDSVPDLGTDLYGQPVRSVTASLEKMVRTAAEHNIAVQFARLGPAVSEAQVASAEASFDWTLFNNFNWTNQNSPQVGTSFSQFGSFTPASTESQAVTDTMGIRRTLISGGRLTVQQDTSYTFNQTPGQRSDPNAANQASFTVQYDQPLLKGAGTEVTQAEIRVARNAERTSVQTLRRDLIRVVTEVEKQYWSLLQAYADLQILTRLLERGEKTRDLLKERVRLDANQAQIADAVSRVERRRVNVLQAQQQVKDFSDKLKTLVNDPSLPVGSEIVLAPSDRAVVAPIKFSLVESLRQAIQNRPEVQSAIIAIDDASIRQAVARNARLPDLSVRLQTRWSSLDDDMGQAYGSEFNGNFVDYVVGMAFEMPIGNRKAEAEYRRRRLERMQSVLAYRNAVQQAVVDVKGSLRRTQLSYEQIVQTEIARIAAAESLRVLEVEKQFAEGISVERLDLELNRQEDLARAEREEIQARIGYNAELADLFAALGTSLERNKIDLIIPASSDVPWNAPDR